MPVRESSFYGGAQYVTAASGGSYAASGASRVVVVNATSAGVTLQLPPASEIINGPLLGGPVYYVINGGPNTFTVRGDNGATFTLASAAVAPVCFDSGGMVAHLAAGPTPQVEDALIAGGGGSGSEVATAERFDFSAETFSAEASMSNARAKGAAAACRQGFYIAQTRGGSNLAERNRGGSWSALPNLSSAREGAVAESLDSAAYFFGGDEVDVERLDVITETWAARSSLPLAREDSASCSLSGARRVLIVSGNDPAKITLAYHEPTDSFETLDPYSSTPRGGFTAIPHDGRALLAGGAALGGSAADSVELFDPITRVWSAGPSLPAARTEAGGWANGEISGYIGGGLDSGGSAASAVYRLRGRSAAWSTLGATLSRAYIANQCAGGVV